MVEHNEADTRLLQWLADIFWTTPRRPLIEAFDPAWRRLDWQSALGGQGSGVCADVARVIAGLDEAAYRAIAVDYTALFCGSRRDAPFPYESIYRSAQRLLMQDAAVLAKRLYAESGFVPDLSQSNEPADHISLELRFVAFLWEEGRPAEARAFLAEHLVPWLPTFAAEVRQQADTEFFATVVGLLDSLER